MWDEGARHVRTLPVKLTEEELDQRRDRLATLINDKEVAEIERKVAAKAAKDEIDEMGKNISDIARWIRDGAEPRHVGCIAEANFRSGKMELVREDTGEVIDSRPLTAEERQRSLLPSEKPTQVQLLDS